MNRRLAEIFIYPIKSLGGIHLAETLLTERGLAYDRRWMLIDERGFLTQREIPELALFKVVLHSDHLEVNSPQNDISALTVPLAVNPNTSTQMVSVWGDTSVAQSVSTDADDWFSEALNRPCSLVYMPDNSERTTSGKVSGNTQSVSFADDYPALLTGQASLDDLNNRLTEAVSMHRFRPNLVFTGGEAYEEDQWHSFTIGEAQCWAEKPCARCTVITINPETTEQGKEPLATLAKYRKQGNKVLFGQSIFLEAGKTIRVGDVIQVKTTKSSVS